MPESGSGVPSTLRAARRILRRRLQQSIGRRREAPVSQTGRQKVGVPALPGRPCYRRRQFRKRERTQERDRRRTRALDGGRYEDVVVLRNVRAQILQVQVEQNRTSGIQQRRAATTGHGVRGQSCGVRRRKAIDDERRRARSPHHAEMREGRRCNETFGQLLRFSRSGRVVRKTR
ncbi:uncharacterized protein LOC117121409 [Anneissia japonica]|uniref:uncharacterized protein LOC117121409 n=1 Tax=Anneissia japonica TaxID=1529436 RepID=UPI00142574E4|nr:uncharacterized protein LOC117121409 [Anneissia japonica]